MAPKSSWAELAKFASDGIKVLKGLEYAKEIFDSIVEAERQLVVVNTRVDALIKQHTDLENKMRAVKEKAEADAVSIVGDAEKEAEKILDAAADEKASILAGSNADLKGILKDIDTAKTRKAAIAEEVRDAEQKLTDRKKKIATLLADFDKQLADKEQSIADANSRLEDINKKLASLRDGLGSLR